MIVLFLLAAVPCVFAVTLSEYPYFFVNEGTFEAIYVVGEEAPALDVVSATAISTALARYPNVSTAVGTSRVDSEIPNIVYRNAIVIGSPCENKAAAILEGNPSPCYANLSGGIGYLKLFEQNGKKQLLITGLTDKDRNAAAKFLASAQLSNVLAKEFQVASGSGSSVPSSISAPKNITPNNQVSNISDVQSDIPSAMKTADSMNFSNQTSKKEVKKSIGEYEPLSDVPKRKGFFSRMWDWIVSLFR